MAAASTSRACVPVVGSGVPFPVGVGFVVESGPAHVVGAGEVSHERLKVVLASQPAGRIREACGRPKASGPRIPAIHPSDVGGPVLHAAGRSRRLASPSRLDEIREVVDGLQALKVETHELIKRVLAPVNCHGGERGRGQSPILCQLAELVPGNPRLHHDVSKGSVAGVPGHLRQRMAAAVPGGQGRQDVLCRLVPESHLHAAGPSLEFGHGHHAAVASGMGRAVRMRV
mmetsp:Transcript_23263/g.64516  ORF Transcript_23263/g.64516 Transcript_23263/m.64516 type:complete len:229 (-) Transcript_23263:36-722(-)